jgi:DNA-binding HxlR family transcriptional regulator
MFNQLSSRERVSFIHYWGVWIATDEKKAVEVPKRANLPPAPAREVLRLLDVGATRATLMALARGRMRPADLERRMIAHSSLYRQLRELEAIGAIAKRQIAGPPHATEYELLAAGQELRRLVACIEAWLRERPGPALKPESEAAWKAVAALNEGWAGAVMQRVAARPLSRGELSEVFLPTATPGELKGRLDRLLSAGIVERAAGEDGANRYGLTEWGRRGVGMLAAAAAWESAHAPERSTPIGVGDAVVALRATLPLVELPEPVAGLCDFTVKPGPGSHGGRAARVWVAVAGGRVSACGEGSPRLPTSAWAQGSIAAWLSAVIDRRPGALQVGGEVNLARSLLEQLHEQLYGYVPTWTRSM